MFCCNWWPRFIPVTMLTHTVEIAFNGKYRQSGINSLVLFFPKKNYPDIFPHQKDNVFSLFRCHTPWLCRIILITNCWWIYYPPLWVLFILNTFHFSMLITNFLLCFFGVSELTTVKHCQLTVLVTFQLLYLSVKQAFTFQSFLCGNCMQQVFIMHWILLMTWLRYWWSNLNCAKQLYKYPQHRIPRIKSTYM